MNTKFQTLAVMPEDEGPSIFCLRQQAYDWKTHLYGRIARQFYALYRARKAFRAEYNQAWHEFETQNGLWMLQPHS